MFTIPIIKDMSIGNYTVLLGVIKQFAIWKNIYKYTRNMLYSN